MLVNKYHKILSFILLKEGIYKELIACVPHNLLMCIKAVPQDIGLLKLCMSCSNERFVCSAPKPDRCEYILTWQAQTQGVSEGWWVRRGGGRTRSRPSTESLSLSLCAIYSVSDVLKLGRFYSTGFTDGWPLFEASVLYTAGGVLVSP